jgi:hypothetical protein
VQRNDCAKGIEYLSVMRADGRVQGNSRAIEHDARDDGYYSFACLIRIRAFVRRLKFKILSDHLQIEDHWQWHSQPSTGNDPYVKTMHPRLLVRILSDI